MYMLKPTWSRPECRKPEETRRQYSPASTSGPYRASSMNTREFPPLPVRNEPPAPDPRNISTLIPIST
jgi:hypothetical protein